MEVSLMSAQFSLRGAEFEFRSGCLSPLFVIVFHDLKDGDAARSHSCSAHIWAQRPCKFLYTNHEIHLCMLCRRSGRRSRSRELDRIHTIYCIDAPYRRNLTHGQLQRETEQVLSGWCYGAHQSGSGQCVHVRPCMDSVLRYVCFVLQCAWAI